jgi:hypothetical protein
MQIQLPIFSEETKLINSTLGFREQDGFVYYPHNGNPIYCHSKKDRNSYRAILGDLVSNHLCSIRALSDALSSEIVRFTGLQNN